VIQVLAEHGNVSVKNERGLTPLVAARSVQRPAGDEAAHGADSNRFDAPRLQWPIRHRGAAEETGRNGMKKILSLVFLIGSANVMSSVAQQPAATQAFTGRLSDSMCGASHQAKAAAAGLSDRECLFACIKAQAKYVLVDPNNQVIPIVNQDAMGIPLYAGRPVKLTGERRSEGIFITKVEAIPAHLHLGHVMTNWRDTPGTRGFLPVAIDEARVAVLHARLAPKAPVWTK
jgi:hypothetical protein